MDYHKVEHILFVDDEESILEVASEYFSIKGYHVLTARNGLEALDILKKNNIDCCFTDINMPVMDGLELAEHINQFDNTIPVIIMTGFPSIENTIRTLKNGVVDFLIKPVNLNHMELCIQRVLQQRKLFVENVLLKQEVEKKARLEALNSELLQKVEDLKTMNRITNEFLTLNSSSDVFNRLVQMAVDITHAADSIFYIINEAVMMPFAVTCCTQNGSTGTQICPTPMPSSAKVPSQIILDVLTDNIPLMVHADSPILDASGIGSLMASPLTIRNKAFGVLVTINTPDDPAFQEKDLFCLSVMTSHAAYAIENLALYENIYQNLFSTIYAFVRAIGARDSYTEQHSNRVTAVAKLIATEMKCSPEEMDVLHTAGLLHDIGKIGIRDEILLKPSRLTDEEYEIIKTHSVIGAHIVGQLGLWEKERQVIRGHHERYDGFGYPDGLIKDEIPLLSRILTVADVYDALASDRTYRKKMDDNQILDIIRNGRGSQFDPAIVDVFIQVFNTGQLREAISPQNCEGCSNNPSAIPNPV
ncbi:MAG: HD domain-containing phosphohydrolase [Desulfatirhabdiaceae bacterium]